MKKKQSNKQASKQTNKQTKTKNNDFSAKLFKKAMDTHQSLQHSEGAQLNPMRTFSMPTIRDLEELVMINNNRTKAFLCKNKIGW